MVENKIVSIVIPVYNSENYIKALLYKLVKEIDSSFEIIVVDDGSSDNSYNEIKEIENTTDAIISVHQDNGGVSSARNHGLRLASGKYVTFVDSDDDIDIHVLKQNMEALNDTVDLIVFPYIQMRDGTEELHNYSSFTGESIQDVIKYSLETGEFNTSCSKLYMRKNIIDNDISFPEKVKVGEDQIFVLRYLRKCNSIKFEKDVLYKYAVRCGSTMTTFHESRFQDIVAVYNEMKFLNMPCEAAQSSFGTFCSTMAYASHYCTINQMKLMKNNMSSNYFSTIFSIDFTCKTYFNELILFLFKRKMDGIAFFLFKVRAIAVDIIRGIIGGKR